MAEFQEVMQQKERMCDSYIGNCSKCELYSLRNGIKFICNRFIGLYPQQAEEIIMKWAEEHPVQTNADKFREVFGVDVNTGGCGSIGVLTTEKNVQMQIVKNVNTTGSGTKNIKSRKENEYEIDRC